MTVITFLRSAAVSQCVELILFAYSSDLCVSSRSPAALTGSRCDGGFNFQRLFIRFRCVRMSISNQISSWIDIVTVVYFWIMLCSFFCSLNSLLEGRAFVVCVWVLMEVKIYSWTVPADPSVIYGRLLIELQRAGPRPSRCISPLLNAPHEVWVSADFAKWLCARDTTDLSEHMCCSGQLSSLQCPECCVLVFHQDNPHWRSP